MGEPKYQWIDVARAPSQLELFIAAASSGNVDTMNDLAVLITIEARGPRDYAMALYIGTRRR
jgi:hypothetical protein